MPTTQLSQVIAQATAPSFLLGAVSGFVAVLIATTLLVIVAFVSALLQFRHEPGAAVMFILALALMALSLLALAREVRIALTEYDHHG